MGLRQCLRGSLSVKRLQVGSTLSLEIKGDMGLTEGVGRPSDSSGHTCLSES